MTLHSRKQLLLASLVTCCCLTSASANVGRSSEKPRAATKQLSSDSNISNLALNNAYASRAADAGDFSKHQGNVNSGDEHESSEADYSIALAHGAQREESGEEAADQNRLYTVGNGDSDDGAGSDDDDRDYPSAVQSSRHAEPVSESLELSDEQENVSSEDAVRLKKLKSLWRARMLHPPSAGKLRELLAEVQAEQKTLLSFGPMHTTSGDTQQKGLIGRTMVYKLLLAELLSDREGSHGSSGASTGTGSSTATAGAGGGLGGRWIDRDTLKQLKGTAALAQHPQYLKYTAHLPHVSRGVRLVAPSATHSMQEALAKALAHATGASLILLDEKAIQEVKRAARSSSGTATSANTSAVSSRSSRRRGMSSSSSSNSSSSSSSKGKSLSTAKVVAALLEEAGESRSPVVIFLRDRGSAVLRSPGACEALTAELDSDVSKTLVLLSTVSDGKSDDDVSSTKTSPTSVPQSPWTATNRASQQMREQQNGEPNGPPNGQNGGSPFDLPPAVQRMIQEAMQSMQQQQQQGGGDSSNEEGSSSDPGAVTGRNGSGGGSPLPPAIAQMLGDALSSEEGRKMLESIPDEFKQGGKPLPLTVICIQQPQQQQQSGQQPQQQQQPGQQADGAGGSLPSWIANLKKNMGSRGVPTPQQRQQQSNGRSGRWTRPATSPGSSGMHSGSGEGDGASRTEARVLLSMFEDVTINAPPDVALRKHWDRWVSDDVGSHNVRRNKVALSSALHRSDMNCPGLKKLEALLAKHKLTDEETSAVVLAALKEEASRAAAAAFPLEAARGADHSSSDAATEGNADADSSSSSSSSSSYSSGGIGYEQIDSEGRLILSAKSMEAAFASVCKAYVAQPGQPMSRTREEVTALAQADRHEAALVTNVILPRDIGVTYGMIGGLTEAKELLRQSVTYPLKFPHLYEEGIAREAVKGVLLFGPPGTGKTMLAKAVATEGGATFLSVDASVIENKWLGESEKNARAVFSLARRLAPCVIYLDEVDSVLSSREKYDDSSHGTLTSVKTTIMQEWDGLRTTGDRVVVIASTNRPFDLDEAVLRRLPRRIMVDLPDAETREEILRVTMANNRVDDSVDFAAVAKELEGFTGSDIKEVCREAVVRIAHEKAQELEASPSMEDDLTQTLRSVTMADFQEARKRLTTSVSEKGRELSRVLEWNEEYGEIKKQGGDQASRHNLAMYL